MEKNSIEGRKSRKVETEWKTEIQENSNFKNKFLIFNQRNFEAQLFAYHFSSLYGK